MYGPRRLISDPIARVALRGTAARPWRRRRFASFGANSVIDRPEWIARPDKISVGSSVLIQRGAWLAVEQPAWEREGPALEIGDHVGIRSHCTISAAERIVIEDGVLLGGFVTIIDSDHTFEAGIPNALHNPLAIAPVRVGAGTWLADKVSVLRGSTIGRCCIVAANSVVRGTIPDYSIAAGVPARVVGSTREYFE